MVHTYYLNGSLIVAEQWSDKLIIYLYDASGAPIGMMYRTTSYVEGEFDVFWFEKNLQGDIVAVYNSVGTKVAAYTYNDAWGNHTASYTNGGGSTGAQYNPFRYRGYYYDSDLGMFYLQSRYYDAKICRFINADSALYHSMIGYNLFAYCNNSPVNYYDPYGEYCIAHIDDRNPLDDWMLEGAGAGGDGASGKHFGYGTTYYTYSVYSTTALYNSYLGGYYSGPLSSGIYNHTYYNVAGAVSVVDSMVTGKFTNSTIRNPWGKNGGPAHQGKIKELSLEYKQNGYRVETEQRINTPKGIKPYRYADLSITHLGTGKTFYINVGIQLKSGKPCARERYALSDIRGAGYTIIFVPYN